jgi:hypothetical protein
MGLIGNRTGNIGKPTQHSLDVNYSSCDQMLEMGFGNPPVRATNEQGNYKRVASFIVAHSS